MTTTFVGYVARPITPQERADRIAEIRRKPAKDRTQREIWLITEDMIQTAITEGRHSDGPARHLCKDCREFKPLYHDISGDGVGVAGRYEICAECGDKRGLPR